jgi:hypothetical protein
VGVADASETFAEVALQFSAEVSALISRMEIDYANTPTCCNRFFIAKYEDGRLDVSVGRSGSEEGCVRADELLGRVRDALVSGSPRRDTCIVIDEP